MAGKRIGREEGRVGSLGVRSKGNWDAGARRERTEERVTSFAKEKGRQTEGIAMAKEREKMSK